MIVETMCDEHELPVPGTVRAGYSWLGGQYVARCDACGLVFGYWECWCEWAHDCDGGAA